MVNKICPNELKFRKVWRNQIFRFLSWQTSVPWIALFSAYWWRLDVLIFLIKVFEDTYQLFWLRTQYVLKNKIINKCPRKVTKTQLSWGTPALNVIFSMNLLYETKMTKVYSKILLMKCSGNNFIFLPVFYLIMWVMKAPKNFGKITILKIWELISLEVSKFTSAN